MSGLFDFLSLSVISGQQAPKREVLIQVWPVNAEGGELDPVQLLRRSTGQPRVASHWKPDLGTAFHHNFDLAVPEYG